MQPNMLCQITQKQASWVWNSLRLARSHDSKIGEESLTDFLVLQLKKESKGTYFIESFTRPREKTTGADWEIWFAGSSGKWLGLRVQAKVISLGAKRYAQLHYRRTDGTVQLDQLVADARKNKATPLYCLYSYWKSGEAGSVTWRCGSFKPNSRLLGAGWLATHHVQTLKAARADSLKRVAPNLIPFHCLFCCQGHGGGDLPSRARAFLLNSGYVEADVRLVDEPPYYVSQTLHPKDLAEDLTDVQDQNLYRVTVIKEGDV